MLLFPFVAYGDIILIPNGCIWEAKTKEFSA
jgi:hypothetical protein